MLVHLSACYKKTFFVGIMHRCFFPPKCHSTIYTDISSFANERCILITKWQQREQHNWKFFPKHTHVLAISAISPQMNIIKLSWSYYMILRFIYEIVFDKLILCHFSKPKAQTKLREIPISPNIHKLQMVTYISCYFRRKKALKVRNNST